MEPRVTTQAQDSRFWKAIMTSMPCCVERVTASSGIGFSTSGGRDTDEKAKVEAKTREVGSSAEVSYLRMIDTILQWITAWFSYQASVRNSHCEGSNWGPILKHVHQKLSPRPRCRSAAQQFIYENLMIVNMAFVSLHREGKGMDHAERLNKRNEVAK